MNIQRSLLKHLQAALTPGKVLVLYGPRQVGKTTLVRVLLDQVDIPHRFISADELVYRDALASQNRRILGDLVGSTRLLAIDEAQRVPDIGINLKILVDNHPDVMFLATGSASFDLANKISEPLTGRKRTYSLFPVSYAELAGTFGAFETGAQLERWLIFGGYPAIITADTPTERETLLAELVGSYLYHDILDLEGVRRSDKIVALLRLLALQIGHNVSVSELAANLALNHQTVARYLDLLEKVFVIFKLPGFSRNLRKEISKSNRYYFYDNGVRNSLIQNLNPLALRADVGQLWENYLMVERRKANQNAERYANTYFWRTYDRKEIDYIEERDGNLDAYEFKWQGALRASAQREFTDAYPGSQVHTVTRENYTEFIG
ncbi:MAG: ATP-binding protein [Chloroflexi bacterium]|nr:ATP-binding protein [Chloroflexota bacterium]